MHVDWYRHQHCENSLNAAQVFLVQTWFNTYFLQLAGDKVINAWTTKTNKQGFPIESILHRTSRQFPPVITYRHWLLCQGTPGTRSSSWKHFIAYLSHATESDNQYHKQPWFVQWQTLQRMLLMNLPSTSATTPHTFPDKRGLSPAALRLAVA